MNKHLLITTLVILICISGCISTDDTDATTSPWKVISSEDGTITSKMEIQEGTLYLARCYGRAVAMVFVPKET